MMTSEVNTNVKDELVEIQDDDVQTAPVETGFEEATKDAEVLDD